MFPCECKKIGMNATKLSVGNVGYSLICISQWWRTATACAASSRGQQALCFIAEWHGHGMVWLC